MTIVISLAAAVHFSSHTDGASVTHNGKRYVICDPTYIGAKIGMEMPGLPVNERKVIGE